MEQRMGGPYSNNTCIIEKFPHSLYMLLRSLTKPNPTKHFQIFGERERGRGERESKPNYADTCPKIIVPLSAIDYDSFLFNMTATI